MTVKNLLLRLSLLLFIFQLSFSLYAQQQSPIDVSLRYIEMHQKELGLDLKDFQEFQVNDLYMSKHNGVTHVYLNQSKDGIKVQNAIFNVNVLPDGTILNVGNRFIANLQEKINDSRPSISAEEALQKVVQQYDIKTAEPIKMLSKVDDRNFLFDPTGIALDPIKVKLVYQPSQKSVRLAWMVEIYQLDGAHWWNVKIDANTGALIASYDQVIHCDFESPATSCSDNNHVHAPVSNERSNAVDINSYNVFPLFIQSPNHGGRELVSSPANLIASPFGWHDTNGVDGPEFTITRGNNVHAYHDIFSINASSGDEPEGGASLDFDFPLDLSTNLPYSQVDPAVTNLFYWNNIIHDLWYQYGFDEVSGNFQVNNYGNGGQNNDAVRAEALDGGGTNNANFGTGGDGSNARMQMYIWTNDPLPGGGADPVLIVNAPMDVAGEYDMVPAGFGNPLPSTPIISEVVLVDDGVDITSNACEDIINGAELEGLVALIDRGDCEFGSKVLRAENAGAVAVIVCNNNTDPIFGMGPGDDGGNVTIPSVMISLQDCNTLKTGLPGLTVELVMPPVDIPMPGPSGFDGDFDNGIIAHEYGHGISIRLTGGPSTGGCLSNNEQAGEGWSDWFALVMTTTENNTAAEGRGIGTYAVGQPTTGGGIRQYRYSRDMGVNPHTYGNVPDVAIPHGVGSIWCVMIWDLFWNMVDEHGYDSDIYNGTGGNNMTMQLVMDGLKLQSCGPSFIDSRDAILAADVANFNGENQCLIWETFARRGLGWSASAGGNEAFDKPPFCTPVQVVKTASSDEINAGETITYTVEIFNNLSSLLSDIVVNDEFPSGTTYLEGSLSCSNGTVNNGVLTIDVENLEPATSITCTYQLVVDAAPFSFVELEDGVEDGTDNWVLENPIGNASWETNSNSYEGDLAWFAEDIDSESDQYLILSEEIVLEGDNPVLSFWHWYDTEASWDGGVVEVSTNDGNTWNDLGDDMIQNGYNGTLEENPASPISARDAFNGNSGGYIQTVISLSDFIGDAISIRFRLGCDGAVGGNGWYVDNVQFYDNYYAITNIACVSASGAEEFCDEATTVVFGSGMTATNDVQDAVKVSVSPNPTKGVFTLSLEGVDNSAATIQIMNIDGRLLQSRNVDQAYGMFDFDLSTAPAGVYLLQVQTAKSLITKKIIVE